MIRRTIIYKNKNVLLKLYQSLVRPHVEYCTEDIHSIWSSTEVTWKWDSTFSPKDLSIDGGTVWPNGHWMRTRLMLSRVIYSVWEILGWVSSRTDVRLTHWLYKFILVWPHQLNDQVNDFKKQLTKKLIVSILSSILQLKERWPVPASIKLTSKCDIQ